jgi:uncharacterized protein
MKNIAIHLPLLIALCQKYKVKTLYAFGSVLTDEYNNESDIDLIVDFLKMDILNYADNYFDFKFSLERLFNKPIDLLENQAIKNPYFIKTINQQKQLIYG